MASTPEAPRSKRRTEMEGSAASGFDVPPSEAEVFWNSEGAFDRASIMTYGQRMSIDLQAAQDVVRFRVSATNWQPVARNAATIDLLKMNGTATRDGFEATEVGADLYAGNAQGSFAVSWAAGAANVTAGGEFMLRRLDLAKLLPLITANATASGLMDGTMKFSFQAPSLLRLLATPQVSTTFTISRGWLGGIDLVRLLRESANRGGRTVFEEWAGIFQVSGTSYSLRQMRLVSGPMTATGVADIDTDGRLTGRINAQLSTGDTTAVRSGFGLSGSLQNMEVTN
jgi:hypothetical protein